MFLRFFPSSTTAGKKPKTETPITTATVSAPPTVNTGVTGVTNGNTTDHMVTSSTDPAAAANYYNTQQYNYNYAVSDLI